MSSANVQAQEPLASRAVIGLTGVAYWCVGLAFSFLDRHYGSLGLEVVLWLVWAVLGFGAGMLYVGRAPQAGSRQWHWLGALGVLLALFPGFLIYNLLRWTSLLLMVVIGARAAVLKTRRDLYFTLTVIFVVSFMAGTHGSADWTLWFYLGPAWVFGALALAWDHASAVALSRWTKALMTLAFVIAAFLVAVLLFFFAPRPPLLGFGFLPPGTDTPGLFQTPGGGGGDAPAGAAGAAQGGVGAGGGHAGASRPGSALSQWETMLQGMRQSAADPKIPQWQRSVMQAMLDAAQSVLDALQGSEQETAAPPIWLPNPWLLLLILLVLGLLLYGLWRKRYRWGVDALLGLAWLLAWLHPVGSMRLSVLAMAWCLQGLGYKRLPGQSVREHWGQARGLAPLPRRWLGYAVETYCAVRFGAVLATREQAFDLRNAVHGASDITRGVLPGLNR